MFAGLIDIDEETPSLPSMPLALQVDCDYDSVGLSLKAHPLSFIRPQLSRMKVVTASALQMPDKSNVRVAGLVLVRQQPSTREGHGVRDARGRDGHRQPDHPPRRLAALRTLHGSQASTLLASGRLQHAHNIIHVSADKLDDLTEILPSITPPLATSIDRLRDTRQGAP